jgi:hypothetical protein
MNAKLNNTNISKGHGDRKVMGTALDPSIIKELRVS